jgi:hypothetical protein
MTDTNLGFVWIQVHQDILKLDVAVCNGLPTRFMSFDPATAQYEQCVDEAAQYVPDVLFRNGSGQFVAVRISYLNIIIVLDVGVGLVRKYCVDCSVLLCIIILVGVWRFVQRFFINRLAVRRQH